MIALDPRNTIAKGFLQKLEQTSDKESQRNEIYAMNKLLAAREESRFDAFCRAKASPPRARRVNATCPTSGRRA